MKRIYILLLIVICIPVISNAQSWTKVSCGGEFTVALRSDGTLWSCGFNGNGQLGVGSTDEHDSLVQIGTDKDWSDIAAGGFHCIALKKDGSLWAWGINADGELGDSTTDKKLSPIRIGTATDWAFIEASFVNSYAIKKNNSLYGWGFNGFYQLADSVITNSLVPLRIGGANDWAKVSAGGAHVLALKTDSTLWSWGANLNGQAGTNSTQQAISTPNRVGTSSNWEDISAGFEFSSGIQSDHTLWTWGFNGNNQLGYTTTGFVIAPQMVFGDSWKNPAAGLAHCFAQKLDGSLWGWGFNGAGQLGINTTASILTPEQVGGDLDWKLVAPATGIIASNTLLGLHTIGIRGKGNSLCATGANYTGQLGTGMVSGSIAQFQCAIALGLPSEDALHSTFTIMLYPNPAVENVTIVLPDARRAGIQVFDVLGNELYSQSHAENMTWNLRSNTGEKLSAGSYIVRASGMTNEGKRFVASRQLIIQP